MDLKKTDKDLNRLILSGVLLAASAAVIVTGGIIESWQRENVPAVIVEVVSETERVSETFSAVSETESAENTADSSDEPTALMININTASAEELTGLKGIGEKIAAKIVEYRQEKPFEKIEDIMNVSGIGEKKFEDIREMICV
ncbi:MAG: helix-hairpin-helix domain-containing protein [Oscillospiraceae bacterium]|nr:helix-hairpin-helix domain-containing protein [Oscillospiraceae bacterium]